MSISDTQFIIADTQVHFSDLLELNIEYMSWVFAEMDTYFNVRVAEVVGMSAADYAHSAIGKVSEQNPPKGVFYIVKHLGQVAGMGGLRGLNSKLAEIKRIYVRPNMRGLRLGEQILARLLEDAKTFGYDNVCLETAPFMKVAHRLYENSGFVNRQPYKEAEVPIEFHDRWRFMEKSLL